METSIFAGNFSNLEKIRAFYASAAEKAGLDDQSIYEVQTAVDEAASNIIEHAYGGQDIGDIECSYEIQPEGLYIFIKDYGKPFDPELVEGPDLESDLCSRKPRGLGLHFMHSLMDLVEFSFNGTNGNVLTMMKKRIKAGNHP